MLKANVIKALRALRVLRSKGRLGRENCPAELVARIIAEKWKLMILRELWRAPVRFADLRRSLPRISNKVLAEQLKDLIEERLIARDPIKGNRAGVQYSLTVRGQSLAPVVLEMHKWGKRQTARRGLIVSTGQRS
jgi:DNA-binding HxlR family transcriptional regulator